MINKILVVIPILLGFHHSTLAQKYGDGRPEAHLRMDARDFGIVLRYGDGPDQCDMLGARDVWVFEANGTYYMHYDAAGPEGWLSSLAVSKDLVHWEKRGPILDFGKAGEDDAAGACYGVTFYDGKGWHMFYLGTSNASNPPDLVPSFPYLTLKARGSSPEGPWIKQKDVVPFRTKPGTYYSITASPGHVLRDGDGYLQFFSSTTRTPESPYVQRTLSIARTKDLDGSWDVDPAPLVPVEEQIENSSLYYEESIKTWFLFTNHIGVEEGREFTDAIWVYWSKDLNQWDPRNKAIVLDGKNCSWSEKCIGLPSVVKAGQRLALFYDAPGGTSTSHMRRHVGLAWLDLPLTIPESRPNDGLIPSQIRTYKTPSETAMLQEKHLYVFNGSTSVGLNPDHLGFHRIVAPPYFAFPFNAEVNMFGQEVQVKRFDWYPSECIFEGEKINGVKTTMQLVPIKSKRGVLVTLSLQNLNQEEITIPLDWTFSGSPGKSLNWEFSAETRSLLTKPFEAPTSVKTDGNSLAMVKLDTRLTASLFGAEVKAENNSIGGNMMLQAGEARTLSLLVLIGSKDSLSISDAHNYANKQESLIEETRSYWTELIDTVGGGLPELKGGTPQLQAFYNTGLMSFLSTRFEIPEFLFNPYYAAAGVDGGACNCYLWDFSYNSYMTALLDGPVMRNQILQFFKVNIDECYAYDPIYGKAQGPRYSYNYYNMARLMYNYLTITGDTGILDEIIDGKTALTCLYEACLGFENMEEEADLIDYGDNHNLLELKKTENYTHVTPSPNGERVLTYQYLTEIYTLKGQKTPHDLVKRGEVLKEKFIRKLWNPELLWINTLDEHGHPRIAYSIQIFDLIRTGMLTQEQEQGILTHLKEGEFLSEWGVHSLAVTDPGYDTRDVDWGGPGAYTGDPAELITDLCQAGYADRGVDLLERILWWGELPYLPQAVRANEKGYREDGRANLIAGAVSCQAIINGLFGVSFELDRIKIKPIKHTLMNGLSLTGVSARGRTFDIEIFENTFTVSEADREMTKALGEEVILNLDLVYPSSTSFQTEQ